MDKLVTSFYRWDARAVIYSVPKITGIIELVLVNVYIATDVNNFFSISHALDSYIPCTLDYGKIYKTLMYECNS